MPLVYIVEDDANIREIESFALKNSGFSVEAFACAKDFYNGLLKRSPDLVLLDIMLPDEDGLIVLGKLRSGAGTRKLPVILVTAKTTEVDKVKGLDGGADDYMTKPFSPREVVARVKAVLRRSKVQEQTTEVEREKTYHIGALSVYPDRFEATLDGKELEFTPKEFELLVYLLDNKNRVLTRDQLLSAVWHYDFAGDTRIVDVHISHLRDQIEENSRKPKFIKTIRGLGYKFEEPKG